MITEIGSNFWQYETIIKRQSKGLWWQTSEYNIDYFKSGRNAIKALCHLINAKKKSVLLPAYTCSTVIDPFVDEGWNVGLYYVNKDLTIDTISLEQQYAEILPSIILFHSYFGFDTLNNELGYIKTLQDRGVVIIEDITQSILSPHRIPFADFYVSSLRKYLAIPDGGFILSTKPIPLIEKKGVNPQIARTAFQAFDLKAEYFKNGLPEVKEEFRSKYQTLNALISDNGQISDISPESLMLFDALDVNAVKKKRRDNYAYLLKELSGSDYINAVILKSMGDSVPLYLPVYIENRRKDFQRYMAENQVYCPIIWPKPVFINNCNNNTDYMYRNMLCFPIDQRYGIKDMERIAYLVNQFR